MKMIKNFVVGQVSDSEKKEIEFLFERMNSLQSLSVTLAANNDLFQEKSHMYERIVTDLSETQKKYSQWWEFIGDKYYLDRNCLQKYHVDFQDGSLFCQNEEVNLENS